MQRPPPRFRSDEYFVHEVSEEMFYPSYFIAFIEIPMGTPYWCLSGWGTETSVTEFCYKI